MVDSIVPDLELSVWEGHLGDLEGSASLNDTVSTTTDEKRPRIIAAGPPLPDGRRKRLFIVEPLGMWVNNGDAAQSKLNLPALTIQTAAQDAFPDPVPDRRLASGSPVRPPAVPIAGGATDVESRGQLTNTGAGQPSAALSPPAMLASLPDSEPQPQPHQHLHLHQQLQLHEQQLYPQQLFYHPQQHSPQRQPQLTLQQPSLGSETELCPDMAGYAAGPVRRGVHSLSFPQHLHLHQQQQQQQQPLPMSAARFQPYAGRAANDSPCTAALSRLVHGGGGLPLLPPLESPPLGGDCAPCANESGGLLGDVMFGALQRQSSGSGWIREGGLGFCSQLRHMPRQDSLPAAAAAAAAAAASGAGAVGAGPPAGAAAATLWSTWTRGGEIPLQEQEAAAGCDGISGGGGGGLLTCSVAAPARRSGQFIAASAASAATARRSLQGGMATPPLPSSLTSSGPVSTPFGLEQQQLQQLLLQHQLQQHQQHHQHHQHQQHQQQQLLFLHQQHEQHQQQNQLLQQAPPEQLALQHQQQPHPAVPQGPRLTSDVWSSGCAEFWTAKFGEIAPAVVPQPGRALPQPGTDLATELAAAAGYAGRGLGAVRGADAPQMRTSAFDLTPRP